VSRGLKTGPQEAAKSVEMQSEFSAGSELYRAVIETAGDGFCIVDREGRILEVNDAFVRLLGYSRDELRSMHIKDIDAKESPAETEAHLQTVIRNGSDLFETVLRTKAGALRQMEITTSFWPIEKGRLFNFIRDITERKRIEASLRESVELYRTLFEEAGDYVFLLEIGNDKIPLIVDANESALRAHGYTRDELLGKPISIIDPDETPKSAAERANAVENSNLKTFTVRHRKKDGSFIQNEVRVQHVRVHGRQLVLSVERDVTEQRQMEDQLRNSEAKYRRLYNETPVLMHSIDRNANIVDVNDHWLKVMGYERSEVVGRKATDFYTEASKKYAIDVIQPAFFRDGFAEDVAYQFVKKNGEVVDVLLSATSERDASGNVVRSQAVIVDVTETKRLEARTKKYADDLQRLLSVTRDMAATADISRLYRVAIQTARDLLQFDFSTVMLLSDDGKGLTIMDTIGFPASLIGEYRLVEGQGLSTHVVVSREPDAVVDFLSEGRFIVPPVVHQHNIRSALCVPMMLKGQVFGVLIGHTLAKREFSYEDVSLYQSIGNQAAVAITNAMNQQALHENQARLDLAVQAAHMGVWRFEIKENKRHFDVLACQLLGIDPPSFSGSADEFFRVVHPDDREHVKAALARTMKQSIPYEQEYRVVRSDNSTRSIASRGSLLRDEAGEPVRINGVLWDITDQRLLEEERLKTQKLESLGTLAGGIAHDFNNLLQGVFGYISMAKMTFEQKERSLAMLEQAEKSLHQSVNLTAQLLTFSKGGAPIKKVISLMPVIEDAVKFSLSGSRTAFVLSVPEDLRPVEADAGQIGQVIQNIALNADQAMPLGGQIDVTARNVSAADVAGLPNGLASDLVEISVRDHGLGVPAEHLTRIFDPYFTTKEKGSGLGLATSHSIIRKHGGALTVSSELGKGSVFTLYLPAAAAEPEQTPGMAASGSHRRCNVLLMDDDPVVRNVAGALLGELGHEAAFAENGEIAIAKYLAAREAGRPFDVVILDLTIRGGMGGAETVKKLRAIDPGVKAIVSSGYSEDSAASAFGEKGFRASLNKPYTVENLRDVLSKVME
jgi:PAS domain S-box-containing protein